MYIYYVVNNLSLDQYLINRAYFAVWKFSRSIVLKRFIMM